MSSVLVERVATVRLFQRSWEVEVKRDSVSNRRQTDDYEDPNDGR